MKCSVSREQLEQCAFAAQNVAESKGAIQILGYALLEAREGALILRATDLDLSITLEMPADVTEPGSLLLNAKTLYETVKKGINATVLIETKPNNHCHLSTGTDYELVGLDANEFPEIPNPSIEEKFVVAREAFVEGIKRVVYSASDSEARPALNGVFVEPSTDRIRLVSTDGHRLAATSVATQETMAQSSVILSRKGVAEVIRSIPSSVEALEIGLFERFAVFAWEGVQCTLRLVNAEFPNYKQVIPKSLPNTVLVDRQMLLDSISRVGTVSSDRFNSIKLRFEGGQKGQKSGVLELTCNNFEQGESKDTLAVEYSGDVTEIGFNIKYLQQSLQSFKTDVVAIRFQDHLNATLVDDPEDADSLAVIMPLRI